MENQPIQKYYVRPLPFKPPRVVGFSESTLESLYEDNYGAVIRQLNELESNHAADGNVVAIKAGNANKLHLQKDLYEAFFNALSDDNVDFPTTGKLREAVVQSYDELAKLNAAFVRAAGTEPGSSTWVALAWSRDTQRLVSLKLDDGNPLIENTDLVFALPLGPNIVDADFAGDLSALVNTFVDNIAWKRVSVRFDQIVSPESTQGIHENREGISIRELQELSARKEVVVLDVRLEEDRTHYGVKIPDTPWIEVHDIETALDQIPSDRPVVTYCVYGFWVSQDSAAALRKKGVDARYLEGGMAAWRAMGYSTESN